MNRRKWLKVAASIVVAPAAVTLAKLLPEPKFRYEDCVPRRLSEEEARELGVTWEARNAQPWRISI